MKIVSLLPSATEIVYALGLEDDLMGVTFECDFPPAARAKPSVSGTALPEDLDDARDIDDAVRAKLAEGEPIYTLDAAQIAAIKPDLILAQDLCRVCAVPSGAVDDALDVIGCKADVLSLDPSNLDDVIACIGQVGAMTGTEARAATVMAELRARVDAVRAAVTGAPRPRVFALEWSDPPFSGGHWVPDMIEAAGGTPVLGDPGQPSHRLEWSAIEAAAPDVVVFMPCGYNLEEAATEGRALLDHPSLRGTLYAADSNALFSRPGPRVVDGVEALAAVLHPDLVAWATDAIIRIG